ncbi:MAG: thioredoxin-related protein [Myxococcota bacterium]
MRAIIPFFLFFTALLFIQQDSAADVPSSAGHQAPIEWQSIEEAIGILDGAEKNDKLFFVDVYLDGETWGARMSTTTFTDPRVIQLMREHFHAVKLNAEMTQPVNFRGHTFQSQLSGRRSYHELALSLLDHKVSFPCTVFLDEGFNVIQRLPGFHEADAFALILDYIGSRSYQSRSWEDFQAARAAGGE